MRQRLGGLPGQDADRRFIALGRTPEEVVAAGIAHVLADGGVDIGEANEAGGEIGGDGGEGGEWRRHRDGRPPTQIPSAKDPHSTNTLTLAARPAASMTVSVE